MITNVPSNSGAKCAPADAAMLGRRYAVDCLGHRRIPWIDYHAKQESMPKEKKYHNAVPFVMPSETSF